MKAKSRKNLRLKSRKNVRKNKFHFNLLVLGLIVVILFIFINQDIFNGLVGLVISGDVVRKDFDNGNFGLEIKVPPEIVGDVVNEDLIQVSLKQGEAKRREITITNYKESEQFVEFVLSDNLKGLIFISENNSTIRAKQDKVINLTFISLEDTKTGVYVGDFEIKTNSESGKISLIQIVESTAALSDVNLEIPRKYKRLFLGEELLLELDLINLGETETIEVLLKYFIKDFNGDTIINEEEVVVVDTRVAHSKFFYLPSTIDFGDYLVIVQLEYADTSAYSSNNFEIVRSGYLFGLISNNLLIFFSIFWISLIFLIALFLLFVKRKEKKKKKKIGRKTKRRKRRWLR